MFPSKRRLISVIALATMLLTIASGHHSAAQTVPTHTGNVALSTAIDGPSASILLSQSDFQRSRSNDPVIFGEPGYSGEHGQDGRPGQSGDSLSIHLPDDTAAADTITVYDKSGQPGADGNNGKSGEPARACRVPHRPAHSLIGANGGDGGNGGNGGDGGKGGSVSIYYSDPNDLKQLAIDSSGADGGASGNGADGGDGCECVEPEWTINYCEWEVWKTYLTTETGTDPQWILDSRQVVPCTGVKEVDERENAPSLPNNPADGDNVRYQLVYQGITGSERFRCQDGEKGARGTAGQQGTPGGYGWFKLVPRDSVPTEKTEHRATITSLIGQPIELVKNIWVNQSGLRNLLNPNSDIPDTYSYLQSTQRPKFQLVWATDATPAALGVDQASITTSVKVDNNQVNLTHEGIPDTLNYTIAKQQDIDTITVTGGFSPTRLTSFKVKAAESNVDVGSTTLVLVDEGDLYKELSNTSLEITCFTKQSFSGVVSSTYQERHSIQIDIPPTGIINRKLTISDNQFTFDLGSVFEPWLKSGYDGQYAIKIQQTTNSGGVYTQTETVSFKVP